VSLQMIRDLLWLLSAIFCVPLLSRGSNFCPIRSPLNDAIYITDAANRTVLGVTLTKCSMECMLYAALNAGNMKCRCFNYNTTSMNCSLFNYEPTNYRVDQSRNMVANQVGLLDTAQNSFNFLKNHQRKQFCRRKSYVLYNVSQ